MKFNKILACIIAFFVLSFSFLSLVHIPQNAVNSSLRIIKTVMPFPGKTVFMINKFIKSSPREQHAHRTAEKQKQSKNDKLPGFLFYILSSMLVCNEQYIIMMILAIAFVSFRITASSVFVIKDIYIPPDIKYYTRWRLKFITPLEKCIMNLAAKYDINPIFMFGKAKYALEKIPAL